jgi:hypothetical protein
LANPDLTHASGRPFGQPGFTPRRSRNWPNALLIAMMGAGLDRA